MMLGKTAGGLIWMCRYLERSANSARLIEAGSRMTMTRAAAEDAEWNSILETANVKQLYMDRHEKVERGAVIDFLLRDKSNPSSVMSVIEEARSNARMVRVALTREVWEAVNDTWMRLKDALSRQVKETDLPHVVELIRQQAAQVRGALHGTMLRNEIFNFARIGTFIERADNTARILDVKYFALLDPQEEVAGSVDTYQWAVILRATSSLRSFNWVYGCGYDLDNIVDFLVLNTQSPRSLAYCIENVTRHLDRLSRLYAERHDCHEICASIQSELNSNGAEEIIQEGLHEFLTRFVARNNWLSTQIGRDYHFASMAALGAEAELEVLADERSAEPPVTQAQS